MNIKNWKRFDAKGCNLRKKLDSDCKHSSSQKTLPWHPRLYAWWFCENGKKGRTSGTWSPKIFCTLNRVFLQSVMIIVSVSDTVNNWRERWRIGWLEGLGDLRKIGKQEEIKREERAVHSNWREILFAKSRAVLVSWFIGKRKATHLLIVMPMPDTKEGVEKTRMQRRKWGEENDNNGPDVKVENVQKPGGRDDNNDPTKPSPARHLLGYSRHRCRQRKISDFLKKSFETKNCDNFSSKGSRLSPSSPRGETLRKVLNIWI